MDFAQRVKLLREHYEWSQEDLAKRVRDCGAKNVRQPHIQQVESGRTRQPKYLLALAKAFNVEAQWLQDGLGDGPDFLHKPAKNKAELKHPHTQRLPVTDFTQPQPRQGLPFPVDLPPFASLSKDLPVYGVSVGGSRGDFTFNGERIDTVRRPPGLVSVPNAFALYLQGDSMSPWKDHGALLYLHPGRPVKPGDYVVVEMKPEQEGEAGACFVKRLRQINDTRLVLQQYNPPNDKIIVDRRRVLRVLKVLDDQAELMGG